MDGAQGQKWNALEKVLLRKIRKPQSAIANHPVNRRKWNALEKVLMRKAERVVQGAPPKKEKIDSNNKKWNALETVLKRKAQG